MQTIDQLWMVLKAKNGQEWTHQWSQSPFQIHMHPTEAVACRLSLVFLSSGFSGKPRQRILTKIWYYKHLESYFLICTVKFCPKISAKPSEPSHLIHSWICTNFSDTYFEHLLVVCEMGCIFKVFDDVVNPREVNN